jgi:regulator of replication initiation timing
VAVSALFYAGVIYTQFQNLQLDVSDIKTTLKQLATDSTRTNLQMENLQKSVSKLEEQKPSKK